MNPFEVVSVLLLVLAAFLFGLNVNHPVVEFVEVPVIYNNTVTRVVNVSPVCPSWKDARNEGYLDGVAECNMQGFYSLDERGYTKMYGDNVEAFYDVDKGWLVVQTRGRTSDEVLSSVVHELIHRDSYAWDKGHFCG